MTTNFNYKYIFSVKFLEGQIVFWAMPKINTVIPSMGLNLQTNSVTGDFKAISLNVPNGPNDPKWPKWPKVIQNDSKWPNWPRMTHMAQRAKMAQNYPNGPKWPKKAQPAKNGPEWPRMTQNDPNGPE